MTRHGPRRTPGEQLAEAFDLANRLWPGKFWLFGKGSLAPAEPQYGFRVFDPHKPDHPIAESEHDDPYECVMRSIDTGRAGATSMSPAATSARMQASERVANAIDPEVGFPSDHLLRRIHADLEGRGRKNPAFEVSVHHRNIVLSAAAKALRSHEMPWSEWLEQCEAATEQPADDVYRCPICDDAVRHGDVCAADIELGTCHAACLHGAPTVDLETGETLSGPIPTFRYEAASIAQPLDEVAVERLARWAHTFLMAERWKGEHREDWERLRPEMRQWWRDEASRFLRDTHAVVNTWPTVAAHLPAGVLCYVDQDSTAFFTTQPLEKQQGDDWNDAPYESNAGYPYRHREGSDDQPYSIGTLRFSGPFDTPADNGRRGSPYYSVQAINSGAVAWLLANDPKHRSIYAGVTAPQFVELMYAAGGIVFIPLCASPEKGSA